MLDRDLMADLQAADRNLKVADERLTLESTKLMDRAKELEESDAELRSYSERLSKADAELRSYSERLSKNADRLLKACGVTGASGPSLHITNAWFANGQPAAPGGVELVIDRCGKASSCGPSN
jgi:uncharacterized protein YlxW (UPF0749 family)